MLETIKYLNNCVTDHPMDTLDELKNHLGIKYSHDERFPELYVLNYNQIDSPKTHPIVKECRSLVVEFVDGKWSLVSRAFDRFYNYGEIELAVNAAFMTAHEKVDGSLITLFYHDKYGWLYRTKSMIMPTGNINGTDSNWDDAIEDALGFTYFDEVGKFNNGFELFEPGMNIILELVCDANRVVVKYEESFVSLLNIRGNDGKYYGKGLIDDVATYFGWKRPKEYQFDTMFKCRQAASELPNLEEGYVLCNRSGEPVCKVKNPGYVMAFHLRGELGLTVKRILDLIKANEVDEYLAVFPDDSYKIQPYLDALVSIREDSCDLFDSIQNLPDRKTVAKVLKGNRLAHFVFRMIDGQDFHTTWANTLETEKRRLIKHYVKAGK